MTVKELIEKLKEFDENMEVLVDTTEWGFYSVEKVKKKVLGRTKDWSKEIYVILC